MTLILVSWCLQNTVKQFHKQKYKNLYSIIINYYSCQATSTHNWYDYFKWKQGI